MWRWALWFVLMAGTAGFYAIRIIVRVLDDSSRVETPAAYIAVVILLGTAYLALRVAVSGAYARPEGLRIIGPLGTRELRWSEITGFRLRDFGPFREAVGGADTVSGESVAIWGIGRPNPISERPGRSIGDDLISDLNGRLAVEHDREGGPG